MRRPGWWAIAAIIAVVAAACSSGSNAATPSTSKVSVAPATSTSTTTGVTVNQVASVVAGARGDLAEQAENVLANCLPLCGELGGIEQFTLGLDAKTLVLDLNKFASPPAEIASLVEDTVNSLQAVADASDDYLTCQKGGAATGTCTDSQGDTLRLAASNLKDELAAWDPYI